MIAVFSKKTGVLEQVVHSLDGVDKRGKATCPAPDGWEETHEWDPRARCFVKGLFLQEKATAKRSVDRKAEEQYAAVVRGGIIGSRIEPAKHAEAVRFLSEANSVEDNYPLLRAEVGLTGDTIDDVARIIASKPKKALERMKRASCKIEPARLLARQAIDAADTKSDIARVLNSLTFPDI